MRESDARFHTAKNDLVIQPQMQKMMQQPRVWLAAALLLLAVRAGSSSGSSADLQLVVLDFIEQSLQ